MKRKLCSTITSAVGVALVSATVAIQGASPTSPKAGATVMLAPTPAAAGKQLLISAPGLPGDRAFLKGTADLEHWEVLDDAGVNEAGQVQFVIAAEGPAAFFQVQDVVVGGGCTNQNPVGYVNVLIPPGGDFIANPLLAFSNNTAAEVIPAVPNGTVLYKPGSSNYLVNTFLGGWSIPQMLLPPGEGFFLFNPLPTPFTVTFVGEVPQGRLTSHLPTGQSLVSSIIPQAGGLQTTLGFPAEAGDVVYLYSPGRGFDPYGLDPFDLQWFPSEPFLRVAQAVWVDKSFAADWTRIFVVGECGSQSNYNIALPPRGPSSAGQLSFFTYNAAPAFGRVFLGDGSTPASAGLLAQVYASPVSPNESGLMRVGNPAPFESGVGAGYVRAGLVTVPTVLPDQTIFYQVRVWDGSFGETFEGAVANGGRHGKSAVVSVLAGGDLIPPPSLNNFPSFSLAGPAAPVLQRIDDQVVHAGGIVVIDLKATDADTPPEHLTFSLVSGPPGATVDPATGVFFWITSDADGGATHAVKVAVSDDGSPPLSATRDFSIQVQNRLKLLGATINRDALTLTWSSVSGFVYRVFYKTNLTDATWVALPGDVVATGTVARKLDTTIAFTTQRFYDVTIVGTTTTTSYKCCHLNSKLEPGIGIKADVIAPPGGDSTVSKNESIPFIVAGEDSDLVLQECTCVGPEVRCTSGKHIFISESMQYLWTLTGEGKLLGGSGPATLYEPPEMEVGQTKQATIKAHIYDSYANDTPVDLSYKVKITRTGLEEYKRTITVPGNVRPPPAPIITPQACPCWPGPHAWRAVPIALNADDPPEIKVCAGERVILTADARDGDVLELKCVSNDCGGDEHKEFWIDEKNYSWSAARGTFPDYPGGARSNGRFTTAIYKAPETAGDDTVTIDITDSGLQAADVAVTKKIKIKVIKVEITDENDNALSGNAVPATVAIRDKFKAKVTPAGLGAATYQWTIDGSGAPPKTTAIKTYQHELADHDGNNAKHIPQELKPADLQTKDIDFFWTKEQRPKLKVEVTIGGHKCEAEIGLDVKHEADPNLSIYSRIGALVPDIDHNPDGAGGPYEVCKDHGEWHGGGTGSSAYDTGMESVAYQGAKFFVWHKSVIDLHEKWRATFQVTTPFDITRGPALPSYFTTLGGADRSQVYQYVRLDEYPDIEQLGDDVHPWHNAGHNNKEIDKTPLPAAKSLPGIGDQNDNLGAANNMFWNWHKRIEAFRAPIPLAAAPANVSATTPANAAMNVPNGTTTIIVVFDKPVSCEGPLNPADATSSNLQSTRPKALVLTDPDNATKEATAVSASADNLTHTFTVPAMTKAGNWSATLTGTTRGYKTKTISFKVKP